MPRGRKKKTEKVVEEKNEADEVKAYLNKMLGGGAVQILNTVGGTKVESIPTGSLALDHKVIASGGIPRGRITEIYGPEQGGKTTLCLHLIAHAIAQLLSDGGAASRSSSSPTAAPRLR